MIVGLLADANAGGNAPNDMLVILPLMLVASFVFLYLPMRKERKQRQELMSNLKKGDRVVLSGFLIATVQQIVTAAGREDELLVKLDENKDVRARVLRSSVTTILRDDQSKDSKDGGA